MATKTFDFRAFVVAYNKGGTITDVANRLGMEPESKSFRSIGKYAAKLIKSGIPLVKLSNPAKSKQNGPTEEEKAWALELLKSNGQPTTPDDTTKGKTAKGKTAK